MVRRYDLRQPIPADFIPCVRHKKVERIDRRAKYLLWYLEDGTVIIMHLGMSGRVLLHKKDEAPLQPHDHVIFAFDDDQELMFNDARRFGVVLLTDTDALPGHPLFSALGPEPLGDDFTPDYLRQALSHRKGPVKPVLMDQKLVVGVGNIYASEALHRAWLHPTTAAHHCLKQADALVSAIRDVLQEAIASGGSTLRDHVRSSGEMGYFQHQFRVYGREHQPCFTCNTPVARITQAGRSTFFCPSCQKVSSKRRGKG